jgi:hypothetical protein
MDTPYVKKDAKSDLAWFVKFDVQRSLIVVGMDRMHVTTFLIAHTTVDANVARNCLLFTFNEDFQHHVIMAFKSRVVEANEGQRIRVISA